MSTEATEAVGSADPPRAAVLTTGSCGVGGRPTLRRGRQSLDQWFEVRHIEPVVVGEVEDRAMLQTLGEHGLGLFAAPTVVRREVCRHYNVEWVGELERVRERFYGTSVERRITHPAVKLIADQAKRRLFA